MILVFGGTTEGRKAVEVLEEAGTAYFYSTKTGEQDITLHHGQRIDGALDREAMLCFCREQGIRLLVDAAHPFAAQLHQTVADVAAELAVPAVRYERIFPERDPVITWLDDYAAFGPVCCDFIKTAGRPLFLLATTGVQSISRLKPLEQQGVRLVYRILPRPSSIALARKQGATDEQLCYYEEGEDERRILEQLRPDAILLKESGLTGGFQEKVEAAKALGIRIFALKRPMTPAVFHIVNGPHGLRRAVERLLPEFFPLKSGLTTGTCATAAAIAATLMLKKGESKDLPTEVPVVLPDGESIHVPVGYGPGYAYCIKQAGDDPDVTDGLEIRATVEPGASLLILGGEGVGRFTLPGFDYPPGEPAINKGPREMIRKNLSLITLVSPHGSEKKLLRQPSPPFGGGRGGYQITISVPDGAAIAKKTFNPRLGIEGGISIIGVSGIVKPFSEEAFIDSIRKCMQVAKASGTRRVVINSGAKSERFVRARYPDLPQQAFVEYGNYIGETLKIAHELAIPQVTLGVMLGKAVKLAAGNLDTHSRRATMDKDFIRQMLDEAHCTIDLAPITLARELWEKLSQEKIPDFVRVVLAHCAEHCRPLLPDGELTLLLIDDEGTIYDGETE